MTLTALLIMVVCGTTCFTAITTAASAATTQLKTYTYPTGNKLSHMSSSSFVGHSVGKITGMCSKCRQSADMFVPVYKIDREHFGTVQMYLCLACLFKEGMKQNNVQ